MTKLSKKKEKQREFRVQLKTSCYVHTAQACHPGPTQTVCPVWQSYLKSVRCLCSATSKIKEQNKKKRKTNNKSPKSPSPKLLNKGSWLLLSICFQKCNGIFWGRWAVTMPNKEKLSPEVFQIISYWTV